MLLSFLKKRVKNLFSSVRKHPAAAYLSSSALLLEPLEERRQLSVVLSCPDSILAALSPVEAFRNAAASREVAQMPAQIFVIGADGGGGPDVKVYDAATGQIKYNFFAYDMRFTGGVRVGVGDVNSDGIPDVLCAAGPGGGPNVSIFNGENGALLRSFFAFGMDFAGGLYVASGDLNADGHDDVIVGADAGGGANVAVFDGRSIAKGQPILPLFNFFPYGQLFTGGVRVAAGDANGDGRSDIICGAGPGGGPNVTIISGINGAIIRSFFPYPLEFTGGVFVASGPVGSAVRDNVVVGAGAGGLPQVSVFSIDPGNVTSTLLTFLAYEPGFAGGVRVGAVDRNGDGRADILAVAGPGGVAEVETFSAVSGSLIEAFFAYDPQFGGGAYIAGG